MHIDGKLALITGASSGMGAAIAIALAEAGARVILLARSNEKLNQVKKEITMAGGKAEIYSVDLTDKEAVKQVTDQIKSTIGIPDILINNAGSGQWKFIHETTNEEAEAMMAMPYFAAFYITKAFLNEMVARNSGHIVNVSSVSSRFVWPGATAYHAARWAIRGFTEALRSDLYDTGIKVSLYESGKVDSPYWETNTGSDERIPKIARLIPVLTTGQVGKAMVNGIRKEKKLIVIPFMMKLIYWQHALFPWAVKWLMTVTGYRKLK
jgi:uncharacterized protein